MQTTNSSSTKKFDMPTCAPLSFVNATSFAPRNKAVGSCDPDGCGWSEHRFKLSQDKWGISARKERLGPSEVCFTFPLVVTDVLVGSEAFDEGIQIGDHIVAVDVKDLGTLPVQV
jgi:hypothetical protein